MTQRITIAFHPNLRRRVVSTVRRQSSIAVKTTPPHLAGVRTHHQQLLIEVKMRRTQHLVEVTNPLQHHVEVTIRRPQHLVTIRTRPPHLVEVTIRRTQHPVAGRTRLQHPVAGKIRSQHLAEITAQLPQGPVKLGIRRPRNIVVVIIMVKTNTLTRRPLIRANVPIVLGATSRIRL